MGTIVVTGASSGIGRAAALRMRKAGNDIIGVDRASDADVVGDLSTPEGRHGVVKAVQARTDRIDGIVLAAGLSHGDPTAIAVVNFFGVRHVLEGLRPQLAAADEAKAVVISSNASAVRANVVMELVDAMVDGDENKTRELASQLSDRQAYAASKFALNRWVRRNCVLPEWSDSGIRVNLVCPGVTRTPMVEQAIRDQPDIMEWRKRQRIPAGRMMAEVDEQAAWCEVLLSPLASFVIGQAIYVDGGQESIMRSEDWPARFEGPPSR